MPQASRCSNLPVICGVINQGKIMLTDDIETLVKESERIYLRKDKPIIPGQDYLRRHFLYPISMISRGFDFAKKEFWIFSFLYYLGIILVTILVQNIPEQYPAEIRVIISSSMIYFAMFAPVFVALFLPPSTFSSSRIDRNAVNLLAQNIDAVYIDSLEKILAIHQERVDKRIILIKRLYAIGWAVFIYIIKQIDTSQDLQVVPSEKDMFSLVIYGMVIMFGFFCVHAYSKSAETIILNIKVAFIEKGIYNKTLQPTAESGG
jgi:hypothetical protein